MRQESNKSLSDRIFEWFAENGGDMTIEDIAQGCLDAGVFPEEWRDRALFLAAKRATHDAMRKQNPLTGLSRAVPITPAAVADASDEDDNGRACRWKDRRIVGYDERAASFEMRVDQMAADHESLQREHQWAIDTFGKAPAMPVFLRGKPSSTTA